MNLPHYIVNPNIKPILQLLTAGATKGTILIMMAPANSCQLLFCYATHRSFHLESYLHKWDH